MTIVAYRRGIMAADTATFDGDHVTGHVKKVIKTPEGVLCGAAGINGVCERFRHFVTARSEKQLGFDGFKAEHEEFGGIIVSADGKHVWGYDQHGIAEYEPNGSFAEGAGAPMALGAMANGANPMVAVRICIENHVWCAGDITTVALPGEIVTKLMARAA